MNLPHDCLRRLLENSFPSCGQCPPYDGLSNHGFLTTASFSFCLGGEDLVIQAKVHLGFILTRGPIIVLEGVLQSGH